MKRDSSLFKRVVFRVVLVVGLVGLAEVGSFLVFWVVDGRPFSYARVFLKREKFSSRRVVDDHGVAGPRTDGAVDGAANRSPDFETVTEILHPYVGYVREPSMEGADVSPRWGGLRVGDHGFLMDDEFLFDADPDRVVIGIAGGSVATFFSIAGIEVLCERLRSHPDFADKEFRVTRMCLGGYKQPQQLLALNYFLSIGAHFDLVIHIDGFNEVSLPPSSNIPKDVYPFFPNHWYTRVSRAPDPVVRRLVGERVYHQSRRTELARFFQQSPLRWSVSWNLAWYALDRRHRKTLRHNEEAVLAYRPDARSAEKHGPKIEYRDERTLYADLVEAWRHASKLMDAACRDEGIEYFHFLQPNQYVPDSKRFTDEERRRAYNPESRFARAVEAGYPGLSAAGRELAAAGVRFTDLTMMFADESGAAYRDPCCHLTNHGNRLLAHAIADAVLAGRE